MADIDREFATQHGLPETQPCDRCGDQPAAGQAIVAGSRGGILKFCDRAGIKVHRREGLEAGIIDQIGEWIPQGRVLAQRVVLLCDDCADELVLPAGVVLVQPGYEDAFRNSHDLED